MSLFTASILAIFIAGWSFAHSRGGPPERVAGAILLAWMVTDISYHVVFGSSDFNSVDPMHLVLDGSLMVAMVWLALRANRMWPLWVAAASLVSMSGHFAILIQPVGMRRAYWALTQLPQYVQLIALLLGTQAHMRRLRKLGQPYRSWRKA